MKFNKIISTALACVMLLGSLTSLPIGVAADETDATEVFVPTSTTITAQSAGKLDDKGEPIINYTSVTSDATIVEDGQTVANPKFNAFKTREEKLATMLLVTTVGNVEVYLTFPSIVMKFHLLNFPIAQKEKQYFKTAQGN